MASTLNPRTDFLPFDEPDRASAQAGGPSIALIVRSFRLLLAFWWIVAPAILGYWGTFPAHQSAVAGIFLLPVLALGLFVPELRWFLALAGAWMIASPFVSGMYTDLPVARTHDIATGALALALGLVPMMFFEEKRLGLPARKRTRRQRGLVTRHVVERVHVSPEDPRVEPGDPRIDTSRIHASVTRAVREEDTTLGREVPIGPSPSRNDELQPPA